mmetsp:Transcript_51237/g.135746  ORF Transcript_51237/g.135746 Transcript_51237/m.135746 type:complete len:121 (-) Transcript_51237:8-370(-)
MCAAALRMVEGSHFGSTHSKLGFAFCLVLVLQPLNAWRRPSKDDPKRPQWKRLHHALGLSLLVASAGIALLGAQLIGATALVPFALFEPSRGTRVPNSNMYGTRVPHPNMARAYHTRMWQ